MHFAIRYLTEYRYDGPVTDNLNALRVTPATTTTQRVDDFGVRVEPQTRLHQHLDYYGTSVIEFGIAKPHESLTIDVRARVATAKPPDPPAGGWPALEGDAYRTRAIEFLLPYAGEPDDLRVDELVGLVRSDTPARHARARGAGDPRPLRVPRRRDLRRLEGRGPARRGRRRLPGLRAPRARAPAPQRDRRALRLGLPVRAARRAARTPTPAEVETHAWLEAFVPPGDDGGEPQWVGIDPTNRCLAGERYVKIGHGRHYRDVPPIKGVYRGTATAKLDASVRMHRTDAAGARV